MQKQFNLHIIVFIITLFILSNILFIKNYKRVSINDSNYYYTTQCANFSDYLSNSRIEIPPNTDINSIAYGIFLYLFGKSSLSIVILSIALASFGLFGFYRFTHTITRNQSIAILAVIILLTDPMVISSIRRCWPQLYAAYFLYLIFQTSTDRNKLNILLKIMFFGLLAFLFHYSSIVYLCIYLMSIHDKKVKKASIPIILLGIICLLLNQKYYSQAIDTNIDMFKGYFSFSFPQTTYTTEIYLNKLVTSWYHHVIFALYFILRFIIFRDIATKINTSKEYKYTVLISIVLLFAGVGSDSLIFPYTLMIIDIAEILYKSRYTNTLYILPLLITLHFFPSIIYRNTEAVMKENRINNILNITESFQTKDLKIFLKAEHQNYIGLLDLPFYQFNPYALKSLDIELLAQKPIQTKIIYPYMPEREIGGIDVILIEENSCSLDTSQKKETYATIMKYFNKTDTITLNSKNVISIYRRTIQI